LDRKLKLGVGAGIAALLIAYGGYELLISGRDTPNYALQIVEKSVENHNKADFYKVVNLESILDDSYNSIVAGVTDADQSMTEDAKAAVKNFTEMLREPLLLSLKAAIDSYIETGEFNKEENASIKTLLERTGLDKFKYRGTVTVAINPKNSNEATARIIVFQSEINEDFVFNVMLERNLKDEWQIVRIQNFQQFIDKLNAVRRVQLDKYLAESEEIIARHNPAVIDSEQKYHEILSHGTLGQDEIRTEIKNLMLEVVKKDWEQRKQELSALEIPNGAKTIHNLRMKICDLEIGYAEDYAQWMDDKKAETAKSADEKKARAKTLKTEENLLYRRLSNQEEWEDEY
jgi:hypothetical protein